MHPFLCWLSLRGETGYSADELRLEGEPMKLWQMLAVLGIGLALEIVMFLVLIVASH